MTVKPGTRDDPVAFLQFVSDVLPHSYAQRFQDLWFLWETGFRDTGSYVEFGALNGRDFSNSYILEQLGWDGVIAEPHPDFEARMRANRNCKISTRCVYSHSGDHVTFHVVKGRPALSSVGHLTVQDDKAQLRSNFRAITVPTISLNDLMREHDMPQVVDCLSIDTEGSEPEILEAYDFEARPINCICVEHNDVARDRLYSLLSAQGYQRKFETLSGHDDWYLRQGAYPNWSDKSRPETIRKLQHLDVFETALHERQQILKHIQAHKG